MISFFCLIFMSMVIVGCGQSLQENFRTEEININDVFEIRKIEISGLNRYSRDEILKFLNLNEGEVYPLQQIQNREDSLRIELTRNPAIPFAKLERFDVSTQNTRLSIQISIDEGEDVLVDSIFIDMPIEKYRREINTLLLTKKDGMFDYSQWENDLENIADFFSSKGFPFALITTSSLIPNFRDGKIFVKLNLKISPGSAVDINHIKISGLTKTRPELASRILNLSTGVRYNNRTIESAKNRLLRTGWFSSVEETGIYRDYDGRYGIVIDVEERPVSSISGALGYVPETDNEGGLAGNLDAKLGNILGTGREFNLLWRRESSSVSAFSVKYSEPFIFGSPLSVAGTLSQEVVDSQYVAFEAGIGLLADIGSGWRVGGAIDSRDISADSLAFGADSLSYQTVGLSGTLEFDNRDFPLNPRSGGLYSVRGSQIWQVSSDGPGEIFENSVNLEQALTISSGYVGFVGLHAREIRSGSSQIPLAEWTRIGGASSVRGYSEGSLLAPNLAWANFEMRYLLGALNRIFFLSDVAVLDIENEISWKYSYGFGLQLDTGMGIINVALALPDGEGFSASVIHVQARAMF
jgi:outer membrane protein assembly factor BamA